MNRSTKKRTDTPVLMTRLIPYEFDTHKAKERSAWEALRDKLTTEGYHCMEAICTRGSYSETGDKLQGDIGLETGELFDNQWNSTSNHRVFDWALDVRAGNYTDRVKTGYYLEMTDAMRAIRAEVTKCGFCGAYGTVTDGPDFCTECYTSQYLKEEDLKLTRMRPINQTGFGPESKFPELTDEERARLTLVYKESQGIGNTQRAIERRKKLGERAKNKLLGKEHEAAVMVANAHKEYAFVTWLLDNGVRNDTVDNLIYYSHTKVFTFGWMDYRPLSVEAVAELLAVLQNVPCDFDFKWEIVNGKTSLHKGERIHEAA